MGSRISVKRAMLVVVGVSAPVAAFGQEADNVTVAAPSWMGNWAQQTWFGVGAWQFVAAFLMLLAGLAAMKMVFYLFEKRVIPYLKTTRFSFDHMFAEAAYRPLGVLLAFGGAGGAVWLMTLNGTAFAKVVSVGAFRVLVTADVLWLVFRFIDVLADYLAKLAEKTESKLEIGRASCRERV